MFARLLAVVVAAAGAPGACGGKAKSERSHRSSGGSSSTGGNATGGLGGVAGTATGGRAAGSGGTGGSAPTGGSGFGGSGGSSGAAGGAATGGEGGAPGGTSSGGEGGSGDCVDVCALHGAACCIPNVECVSSDAHCVVDILTARVAITYDYPTLEQRVAALPQDLLLSFTEADVEWAAAQPAPAARIEFHMTPEMAARTGTTLDYADLHPFRVSCGGQALFVGVTYLLIGAAALNVPVLHAELVDEETLILRLGAVQGAWLFDTSGLATEAKQRIDRAELRAALCRRGLLRELTP